jgi:hypothetical protein
MSQIWAQIKAFLRKTSHPVRNTHRAASRLFLFFWTGLQERVLTNGQDEQDFWAANRLFF